MNWATLWTVFGAVGVTGAVGAWFGGYVGGFLPPPPRVTRAIRYAVRGVGSVVEDGRYHLVLCGLDGDDAREGTLRLLRLALNPQKYPMLRLTIAARCISLRRWHAREDDTAGAAQADEVLRNHGAHAVLWGEVPKQGDSLDLFVRGAGRQETQTITFDKGLAKERPDGALGVVLAAVALSQVAPAAGESGRYLASSLRPVAERLQALLADSWLVPAAERGRLQHALGLALATSGEQAGDNRALEDAVAAFRAALDERTRERVPLDWAMTQNNLAAALAILGERESNTTRLEEAVTACRAALEERTRERVPLDCATTQDNLGNTLAMLGEREDGTARLEEAVIAYRAALEERTRERVPLYWAIINNNLGNALRALGERESGTTRLDAAVAAYRAALEERTRRRVPLHWAMTQNNLGNALLRLGERERGTGRLEEAVVAYRAALEERTRERVPLDWATTQNNLGCALQALGERENSTMPLIEAVAAFRAALEERTLARAPLGWATTQNNLGAALQTLGEGESGTARLEEAALAWNNCLTVTENAWPAEWVEEVRKLRDQALAEIARRRSAQ